MLSVLMKMNSTNTPLDKFTKEERAYAILKLDPFHDDPYDLRGAPSDQSATSTVVYATKELIVNAAAFGLSTAAGDKWDMNVALLPISQQYNAYAGYHENAGMITTGGSSDESPYCAIYPLTAWARTSGQQTFVYDDGLPVPLGINVDITDFTPKGASYTLPRTGRVIGAAFEVIDNSAQMYRQGNVCCYSVPNITGTPKRYTLKATINGETSLSAISQTVDVINGPPSTYAAASTLPGSKTWDAKEGAYVVARQNVDTIPFSKPSIASILIDSSPIADSVTSKNCFFARESYNNQRSPTVTSFTDSMNMYTCYNTTGAYFTGLSSEFGTYTLKLKIAYEFLPDPQDLAFLYTATPTLPRNPLFDQYLDEAVKNTSFCTMQTNNPSKEFWRDVVKTLNKTARVVGTIAKPLDMIGIPGAREAVIISKATQKVTDKKKKKKN